MTTFIEGIQSGVQSTFCNALQAGSNFAGLFPEGLGAGTISDALNGASLAVCNRDGGESGGGGAGGAWSGGIAPAMFSGAQCPDKIYRIGIKAVTSFRSNGAYKEFNFFYEATGAMRNPEVRYYEPDNNWEFWGVSEMSEQRISAIPNGTYFEPALSVTSVCLRTLNTYNCTPEAVDDCGDPPANKPPAIPELDDTIPSIDYDDPNGNPVSLPNVPIKFFKPCINFDGIKIPFELQTPLGKVCGKVGIAPSLVTKVTPTFEVDLCPSQKQGLSPAIPEKEPEYFEIGVQQGALGSPFESSEYGDEPLRSGDIDKPIYGVFYDSGYVNNNLIKSTIIFNQDGNSAAPSLRVPRIGQIRFAYQIRASKNEVASDWGLPIDLKQPRGFVPCPWEFGATDVDVQAEAGYAIAIKPVYRKPCCDSCAESAQQNGLDEIDRCK